MKFHLGIAYASHEDRLNNQPTENFVKINLTNDLELCSNHIERHSYKRKWEWLHHVVIEIGKASKLHPRLSNGN